MDSTKIAKVRKGLARLYGQLQLDREMGRLPSEWDEIDIDVIGDAMNFIEDLEDENQLSNEELSPVAKREAGLIDFLLSFGGQNRELL